MGAGRGGDGVEARLQVGHDAAKEGACKGKKRKEKKGGAVGSRGQGHVRTCGCGCGGVVVLDGKCCMGVGTGDRSGTFPSKQGARGWIHSSRDIACWQAHANNLGGAAGRPGPNYGVAHPKPPGCCARCPCCVALTQRGLGRLELLHDLQQAALGRSNVVMVLLRYGSEKGGCMWMGGVQGLPSNTSSRPGGCSGWAVQACAWRHTAHPHKSCFHT